MRCSLLFVVLFACGHAAPVPEAARIDRAELSGLVLNVAPETLVNEPVLKDRAADLRNALAAALREEGFDVTAAGAPPGSGAGSARAPLTVTTSVDYTPWTSVNTANLFVVVKLMAPDGASIDQVEEHRRDEGFPEPAKVPELARLLAHRLATSPRLRDYLHPRQNADRR